MVEFIGFIISLLALLYIFMKKSVPPERHIPPQRSQEEQMDEEDDLHAFIHEAERAMQLPKIPSIPAPIVQQKKKSIDAQGKYFQAKPRHEYQVPQKITTQAEACATKRGQEGKESRPSRAENAIRRLSTKRDLLIYREIFDQPKSLRPPSGQ